MGAEDEAKKLLFVLWRLRDLLRCFPRHSFSEEAHDPAPDYSLLELWSAHPGRAPGTRPIEDANWLAEPGTQLKATEARPCDCFFVHDTTMAYAEVIPFLGTCAPRWNAPLGPGLAKDSAESMMAAKIDEQTDMRVAAAASVFSSLCRIYAPRYRQATVMAFIIHTAKNPHLRWMKGAKLAFDLAFEDVRRAFVTFVDDPANADRPFIIAGHSQGAKHLLRLLQLEVEGKPDRLRRFVHAYHAGHVIPMDMFSRTLRAVRPSEKPHDIRTVSSWRTGRRGHTLRVHTLFRWMYIFYADRSHYKSSRAPVLATNPVTWSSERGGETSAPEQYRGAVWPVTEGMDPRDHAGSLTSSGVNLRFGHLVARDREPLGVEVRRLSALPVEKGSSGGFRVRVDRFGTTRVPALPRGSLGALAEGDFLLYHDLDFALYHGNIRDNATLRYQAWVQQNVGQQSPLPQVQSRL